MSKFRTLARFLGIFQRNFGEFITVKKGLRRQVLSWPIRHKHVAQSE